MRLDISVQVTAITAIAANAARKSDPPNKHRKPEVFLAST